MTPLEIGLLVVVAASTVLPYLMKQKGRDTFELDRKVKELSLELENVYDQLIKWNKKSNMREKREEQPAAAEPNFNGFIQQREAMRSALRERLRRR